MNKFSVSVVVPFYNEEHNLAYLHKELTTTLLKLKGASQIIYINDGSHDNSEEVIKKSVRKNRQKKIEVNIVTLKRNFGQTAAIAAGIDQTKGPIIVFLDADLQNDPHDILQMLEKLQNGYDAVVGWRKNRQDEFFRKLASSIANYLIIQKIFKVPLHDMGCSLKVVKKEAISNFKLYSEYHRLLPALLYWNGAKVTEIIVNHRPRKFDKSKYGYIRIFKLINDLLTIKFLNSYQTKPSYVFGTLGMISTFFGFLVMIVVLYRKIFDKSYIYNDPLFLIALFLILVGIQIILLGLVAELLVRIYFETQQKPIYEKIREITI